MHRYIEILNKDLLIINNYLMLRNLNLKSLNVKKVFSNGELKRFNESFLGATNANYLEKLYLEWQEDPKSVHASWDAYFTNEARDMAGD